MELRINYKGRKIILKDVVKCQSFFSKLRGLMFGNDARPLFFIFRKPGKFGIHSFFVSKKFLAIWLLNNKIVDVKMVEPWKAYVRPDSEFDMLIEIPFSSEKQISGFLVGSEKDL